MTTVFTSAHDQEVSIAQLRDRVGEIDLHHGLHYLAITSSLILGRRVQHEALANTINVTALAKAFVLWGRQSGGRPLRLTGDADDEWRWLLRACNTLPWYKAPTSKADLEEKMVAWLVRQAYIRHAVDDPLDTKIGRAWIMFHNLVGEGGLHVPDPSAELERVIGVSAEDLWLLGMAIWANQVIKPTAEGNKWIFTPANFVREGPHQGEINAKLARALQRTSLTPDEFSARYAAVGSKYRDPQNREQYWITEFQILRDFPNVDLGEGMFTTPYPTFALTRALDGFYFDLLEAYAQRKRASGAKDNAYDNEMNQTLGTLFQRYVGRQLSLLNITADELFPEFRYGKKKAEKDTPDWLLLRPGQLPVLFECKARQPTLDVQRYATPDLLKGEVQAALGKACRQLARFVANVDAREPGLERFFGQQQFICAVVMLAPLPFHMLPMMRRLIETEVATMEPLWPKLRNRLIFVPMSVRELETVVATEFTLGIPVEQQLQEYADYRERAGSIEKEVDGVPTFPRHIEEFLQERFHGSKRIVNPLCQEVWELFCDWCQRRIFGEGIEETEHHARELATRRLAYALWEHRRLPPADDQRDWYKAEWLLGFRTRP